MPARRRSRRTRRAALTAALACALLAAGCGSSSSQRETAGATTPRQPAGLHVGVVGPLRVRAAGVALEHGRLGRVASNRLVLVAASALAPRAVAAAGIAHPDTHFALIGGSTAGHRRPNVAGVVIRADQAARLAGVVAGLVVADEGAPGPRVAWVGPERAALVAAFTRGVHAAAPGTVVLHAYSGTAPVACKEAAIAALERGASVVVADRGTCAEAAAVGAHDQDRVALSVAGFELPDAAATRIARDAVAGVYYGNEDVIFGARSGVIGIRRLDPRIPAAVRVRAHLAAEQLASGTPPG